MQYTALGFGGKVDPCAVYGGVPGLDNWIRVAERPKSRRSRAVAGLALAGCPGQNLIYGISVPPRWWWPSQKEQVMPGITVGIDGSEPSRRALEWAIKEAAMRNAPLAVLAVHQVASN